MDLQADQNSPICPEGDVVISFDNEQFIGRSWTIKPANKVKQSVIINIEAIQLNEEMKVHQDKDLHPKRWLSALDNDDLIQSMCADGDAVQAASQNNDLTRLDISDSHGTLSQGLSRVSNSTCTSNVAMVGESEHVCHTTDPNDDADRPATSNSARTLLKCNNKEQEHVSQLHEEHYKNLSSFLELAIKQVHHEQIKHGDTVSDLIDDLAAKEEHQRKYKTCPRCGTVTEKTKRKCPNKDCGEHFKNMKVKEPESDPPKSCSRNTIKMIPIQSEQVTTPLVFPQSLNKAYERFGHVPSNHSGKNMKSILLDAVYENPNSHESLVLVLRHIRVEGGRKRYGGNKREWMLICGDGLPYTLVFNLIQQYLVSSICKAGFMGANALSTHQTEIHQEANGPFFREFDWIVLKVGDGHYEMNLMKSFMDINWHVCMSELAKRMGWKSEAAQKSAKNCSDNHKTWQLLNVFHYGTMLELIVPYVRDMNAQGHSLSVDGFLAYAKHREELGHVNYTYMLLMVTRFMQAIIHLRMGTRRNNCLLVESAKLMSKELFHARTHPRYQQIEILDSFMRKAMPKDLRCFLEQHESVSKSGHPSKGQGLDYLLEETNKQVKKWMVRDVPSPESWQIVIRNVTTLTALEQQLRQSLSLSEQIPESKNIDLSDAITDWRVYLRSVNYLSNCGVLHTSTTGILLDPGLINIATEGSRKRSYKILNMLLQQDFPDDDTLTQPVFVTNQERQELTSIWKQTITKIDI